MERSRHLFQAYDYWKELLLTTDTVIDATCGNGKDTFRLAELVPEGRVISMDIQMDALERARTYATFPNICYINRSHADLPSEPVKLIVYNLGYLPGGDKSITTMTSTTIASLEKAISITKALSITCYPGHPEGALEEAAVLAWTAQLNPCQWDVKHHIWGPKRPSLFYIVKLKI